MIHAIQQTLYEGGLTLYALLVLAVAIYSTLFGVWRHLAATRKTIFDSSMFDTAGSPSETHRAYAACELDEMAWVERRLPFLAILISTAPLLGLLGTVAGMLITFSGMASGNLAPIDTISTGISRALVTTQAGLVSRYPRRLPPSPPETPHRNHPPATCSEQLHAQLAGPHKLFH